MNDVQITFHGLEHSDALDALIREKIAKLATLHDRLLRVRAVIEQPHRSHTKGNGFQLKLEILIPHDEIIVRRDFHDGDGPEAADHVVREAFATAQRLLLDRVHRGDRHPSPHGMESL